MQTGRLEAFSDGVLAIIITIMVLGLKIPTGSDLSALAPELPIFLGYLLSFVNVGIYWNNHHHLIRTTTKVGGGVMWANLHLLFWLSLVPITTAWLGTHPRAAWPTALYGIILLLAAIAWTVLERAIIRLNGPASTLARARETDLKGKLSLLFYVAAIALAFLATWAADALYVAVALMWVVPDRRIARASPE